MNSVPPSSARTVITLGSDERSIRLATDAHEGDNIRGVSLTTEKPRNVELYKYFGYEVVGHVRIAPELESWGLYWRKGQSPG